MKIVGTVLIGALLAVEVLALKPVYFRQPEKVVQTAHIRQVTYLPSRAARVGLDLCPTCIDFTGQAINTLLNIILNAGVVGTCGELCSLLEQKTGSQALGAICDILCDVAGIDEFIKLIQKADLDPIYFCELLKVCPIFDGGDAKITALTVNPKSGPQGKLIQYHCEVKHRLRGNSRAFSYKVILGRHYDLKPKRQYYILRWSVPETCTEFVIDLEYQSVNGTGTGEIALGIETVDGVPLGDSFLNEMAKPGQYIQRFNVKAEPDPNCDPTQQICEQWLPGNYVVKIDICNGECGSAHPNSKIYDTGSTNFTLTG